MANWKWFGKLHTKIYQLTDGRIGAKMGNIDIVLVNAIGRKTGEIRPTPIACYPYNDSVVVVGSNNGQEKDPVWWINLKAHPEVDVMLGREKYKVIAEELKGEEREAFWPTIIKINPRQKHYRKMTKRELPVVYLKRK